MRYTSITAAVCAALISPLAQAVETTIGEPVLANGLEIAAVYLQPVEMAPAGMMRAARDSDIHLEADIHAVNNNPNGLPAQSWAPYLQVSYQLEKTGSNWHTGGDLMPMVADDGPHYGDNVRLDGPGKYHLTFKIASPDSANPVHFGRHVDPETGVAPWFEPFEVQYDFVYAGTGKKGGY